MLEGTSSLGDPITSSQTHGFNESRSDTPGFVFSQPNQFGSEHESRSDTPFGLLSSIPDSLSSFSLSSSRPLSQQPTFGLGNPLGLDDQFEQNEYHEEHTFNQKRRSVSEFYDESVSTPKEKANLAERFQPRSRLEKMTSLEDELVINLEKKENQQEGKEKDSLSDDADSYHSTTNTASPSPTVKQQQDEKQNEQKQQERGLSYTMD